MLVGSTVRWYCRSVKSSSVRSALLPWLGAALGGLSPPGVPGGLPGHSGSGAPAASTMCPWRCPQHHPRCWKGTKCIGNWGHQAVERHHSWWLGQGQKEPIRDETLPLWIPPSPNPIRRYNSFMILWFCFWFHFNLSLVTFYCTMIRIRIVKIINILFVVLWQPHRIWKMV